MARRGGSGGGSGSAGAVARPTTRQRRSVGGARPGQAVVRSPVTRCPRRVRRAILCPVLADDARPTSDGSARRSPANVPRRSIGAPVTFAVARHQCRRTVAVPLVTDRSECSASAVASRNRRRPIKRPAKWSGPGSASRRATARTRATTASRRRATSSARLPGPVARRPAGSRRTAAGRTSAGRAAGRAARAAPRTHPDWRGPTRWTQVSSVASSGGPGPPGNSPATPRCADRSIRRRRSAPGFATPSPGERALFERGPFHGPSVGVR